MDVASTDAVEMHPESRNREPGCRMYHGHLQEPSAAMDHMTAPCPTLVKWSEEASDLEEEVQDGVWVLDWSAELSDGEEVSNPLPPQWDDTDGTAGGR